MLLIVLLAMTGAPAPAIHLLCGALLVGGVAHAYGVSQLREDFRFRVAGMALTSLGMVSAALALLYGTAAAGF